MYARNTVSFRYIIVSILHKGDNKDDDDDDDNDNDDDDNNNNNNNNLYIIKMSSTFYLTPNFPSR